MNLVRRATAFFRGPGLRPTPDLFERHTHTFVAARALVRAYYAILLFFACSTLPEWPSLLEKRDLVLLWPVAWLKLVGEPVGWLLILCLYLFGAILAAVFPDNRAIRAIAWVGLLEHAAIRNSFGKINHNLHILVLPAFVLIFLPDIKTNLSSLPRRAERHAYLTIVWGALAITALTYSMAGLGKTVFFFYQAAVGEYHALSPDALAIHVAEVLLLKHSSTLLGPFVIDHSYIGLPMMAGMMYLQLLAFWAAFRPALHKAWGLGLIFFHIGTSTMMGIISVEHILVVGMFMLASPFAASRSWSAKDMLSSLPLLGSPLSRLLKRASRR